MSQQLSANGYGAIVNLLKKKANSLMASADFPLQTDQKEESEQKNDKPLQLQNAQESRQAEVLASARKEVAQMYAEKQEAEQTSKVQIAALQAQLHESHQQAEVVVPTGSGALAAQGGMFAQPKSVTRSPHNPNKRMQQALESSPPGKRLKRRV